ncbi:thioredoxin domain-containing protein [Candidatus Saccharibacteria bacterium]|nr:thioredoxin domain-containing protein [Candidatus Saccharibacteria bacterium]
MKKKIILGIVVAMIAVGIGWLMLSSEEEQEESNVDFIQEASEETGFIGEKIVGNPSEAKVVIYEYADFGCSHCADWNRRINDLMDKHEGEIALVFRSYDLGFKNGVAAARAATAAQIQGYFEGYKDLLFENQAEWFYEEDDRLLAIFSGFFEQASDGSGDLEKFIEDMSSENTKKRLQFEQSLGKKIHLVGTPTFRVEGKTIPLGDLIRVIEEKIKI